MVSKIHMRIVLYIKQTKAREEHYNNAKSLNQRVAPLE